MKTSCCSIPFCEYRNSYGYCSLNSDCVKFKTTSAIDTGCDFCKYDLEDGDILYNRTSADHAIVYEEVVVHYCPVCGRKLKGD